VRLQKSKFKRVLGGALVAVLTVGLVAGCGITPEKKEAVTPTGNKTVNIGVVNWADDVAVSYLWKVLLEEKGYDVNLRTLEIAPVFVGLNKGDLDLYLDAWLPITHQAYWDKYKAELDDYGVWYTSDAKMGLVVPKYMENINSVEELNANKAKFDSKINGINPGAGLMKATNNAIKDYGLDLELIQSSEAAMMTALDKAYREKKSIVITGWSPHWMFAKYDLKYLEDSKKIFGEAEKIHTLANKKFTKSNPEIVKMLKAFKFDEQQMGDVESLINEGMEPEAAAKKWIADNRDLADSWIK